ncbi:MAG: YihY/virulence factor BrkB family protein [Saprospiraceae bacterium]
MAKPQPWYLRSFNFMKEVFANYAEDDALTMGAALAYYTVFSFAPLLVVIISVTGFFAGQEAMSGQMFEQLNGLLGAEAAATLQEIVKNAYISGNSIVATVIGVGTLIFAATGVFNALKTSLNKTWELQASPSGAIMGFIMDRLLSFSFVIGLGFMLLVSLVVNAVVIKFVDQISQMMPALGPTLLETVSFLIGFIVTTVIIALLFRFMPDARARWRDIWAGAIFTSALFTLGKFAIGFYIGNSDFGSTYGAAGALITLLVWTYYSSQIIFLGAEFTFVWAKWRGYPIRPGKHAKKIIRQVKTMDAIKV